MSFSDDDVFEDFKESKKRKKKNRSTELFMTLNLNEKFANMSREQKQKFKDFGVNLFDKRHILSYFRDQTNPENPLANMEHIQISWKPEIAPHTGKLHLHALVAMEHHGFYSFQANELREDARKLFGHSVYLNCPLSSNAKIKWLNYVNK